MNDEIKFRSLEDLYVRLLPALRSKARELNKMGLKYIHEEDIWNFLKENKWLRAVDLDLASMVNDIFDVKIDELDIYTQNILKGYRRGIDKEAI